MGHTQTHCQDLRLTEEVKRADLGGDVFALYDDERTTMQSLQMLQRMLEKILYWQRYLS